MAKGSPIYNPDVQSDIDMKNIWKLVNYPGSGNAILSVSNTIYVDGTNGSAIGSRGTTSAFQTLAQAYAVAQSGDTIVIRPGVYTLSAGITSTIPLYIFADGATIKSSTQSLTLLQFNSGASGSVVRGLTVDGNRSTTTPDGSTRVRINGANNVSFVNCRFINNIQSGISIEGTSNGVNVIGCYFSNSFRDIETPSQNTTIVSRLKIIGNTFAGNYVGTSGSAAIKLNTTATQFYSGSIIVENNITGPGQEGIEIQGSWMCMEVSMNNIKDMTDTGISIDGPFNSNVVGNTVKGCLIRGIEFVHITDLNAEGNVIDGKNDSGTPTTQQGYSISNGFSSNVTSNININGGSVTDCFPQGIVVYRTDQVRISNVYIRLPNVNGSYAVYAQFQQGLTVDGCQIDNNCTNADIFYLEGDSTIYPAPTRFHFRNNRVNALSVISQVWLFFTSNSCSFGDVVIEGTYIYGANAGFCPSGFVELNVATATITYNNNSPTSTTITAGFPIDAIFSTANTWTAIQTNKSNPSADGSINYNDLIYSTQVFSTPPKTGTEYGFKYNTAGDFVGAGGITVAKENATDGNFASSLGLHTRPAGGSITESLHISSTGVVSVGGNTVETQNNKGAVSGYASLDVSGKVPAAQLPTLSAGTIASTSLVLVGDGSGNAVAGTETGTGNYVRATAPTLGAITVTSVDKWVLTAPSTAATLTAGADNCVYTLPAATCNIGFREIPNNSQSTNYTTVLTDNGKCILHPLSDNSARTFTIDAHGTVVWKDGTVIIFRNMAVPNLSVAITTDTMTLMGSGLTGTRTVAQFGELIAVYDLSTTSWTCRGTNVT